MPVENKTHQTSPTTCPPLIYSVHSFTPFILVYFIQQCGQQVRSLGTPGERQIPEEECNKALSLCPALSFSLSLSVCVCAVEGRWAVLQSLPNKLVYTHKGKADSANQSLWDTGCSDFGFVLKEVFNRWERGHKTGPFHALENYFRRWGFKWV